MSGILGCVWNRPRTVDCGKLSSALELLKHRGPDDQAAFFFDGSGHSQRFLDPSFQHSCCSNSSDLPNGLPVAMLAFCRLAVEDVCSRDGRSIASTDRGTFLAWDGVIDNGPELGRELQKLGHNVQSNSRLDAILLGALEQWGPDCLSRVTGSFALAAIDFRRRNVLLARDAFGTRPLYYGLQNDQGLFFASQICALSEISSAARRVNRASLYRYLVHNIMDHGNETFFAEIHQVPKGFYLEASLDQPLQTSLTRCRRVVQTQTKLTFADAADHLRQLVIRSVATQAGDHDVLGAALSGGFDSSFVVAAFKRAQLRAKLKLYTCVPVLKRGTFAQSEETWAELVATGFQAPISKVRVTSEGLPGSFSSLVRLQEEPFSSPVVYAQLQLFQAAQQDGVRIVLSGQGGDTLFAASARQVLLAALRQARRGHWGRGVAIVQAGCQLPHVGGLRQLAQTAIRMVVPKSLRASVKRRSSWLGRPGWLKGKYFEFDHAVVPEEFGLPMLRFEDRNSTACSTLNRMPLLTRELEDFVCSLPPDYLINGDQPIKSIESAAMGGMVPDAILARRERLGFPVPVREWLEELAPWVDTNMAEIECFPFLESRAVRQIWESVRSHDKSVSTAFLVWRWVFLAGWVHYCGVSLD